MANNYTTPQDLKFKNAWEAQASGSDAKDIGKYWPTLNTFKEKLDYVKKYHTSADTKNKDLALKLGVEWLQSNLPKGLLKADGTPYEIADYQNIILPNKTVQNTATVALNNAMFSAAKDIVNGTNTTKQSSQLVELAAGDLIGAGARSSYNPDAFIKGFNTVVAPTLVTPSGSLADIKKQYGSLYDKSGKPLFSDTELKNVYNGSPDALQSFRSKLNTAVEDAVKATDPSFAKAGSNQGSAYVTARNKFLSDPAGTLAQNYNTKVSGLKTSDKGGWVTSSGTVVGGPASTDTVVGDPVSTDNGITGLLPKGSYKDANGNFAYTGGEIDSKDMTDFTQSYNPNKGVYRAPTLNASGKLVPNPTSPYSNILNKMLADPKDPFASGYTSSLDSMQPAAMTSTQLASLSKPFTTNATASDLVKLVNSAGGEYDPTNKAGSTLPPALRQLYQNQTLPDDTVKAKPGVPDPTKMKVPEANFLDLNGDLLYGDIAGGDLTNTPMGGDAKTAAESAYGFTPPTTLKNVPGATITGESGTLTKPVITDKATADALHKAEQDRIAKEAADKAEAAKKALYYNADGTLTGLGFYTYNPTGNYQDYLDKIAADKAAAEPDTGGITSLVDNTDIPKNRGPKSVVDPEVAARLAESERLDTEFRNTLRNDPYWGRFIQNSDPATIDSGNPNVRYGVTSDAEKRQALIDAEAAKEAELSAYFVEQKRLQAEDMQKLNWADANGIDSGLRQTKWFADLYNARNSPNTAPGNTAPGNTGAVGIAGKSDAEIGAQLLNQNQNGFVQNTALLSPGKLYTPELDAAITQQKQQGAVGIAGNPNVNSFTSPDNMNTSATGVGAPITSLLTPNTGASGTPPVAQKPAVLPKPAVIQQQVAEVVAPVATARPRKPTAEQNAAAAKANFDAFAAQGVANQQFYSA
jgi:hypothetical protein